VISRQQSYASRAPKSLVHPFTMSRKSAAEWLAAELHVAHGSPTHEVVSRFIWGPIGG